MKAEEVLELAVKVERKAAAVYRLLHERFREDSMLGYLWYSMALEEDGHAEFIEAEMKMLRTVPEAFGDINIESAALEDAVGRFEELEEFVRNNPVTAHKAVCTALQIEDELAEKIYGDLIEIVSPSLKRIFGELTDKCDHVERLESIARKLGLKCR